MSKFTKTIIRCDECGYEEPNDYSHGVRTWIIIDCLETDDTLHFCQDKCLISYSKEEKVLLSNSREMKNDTKEYRDYINW